MSLKRKGNILLIINVFLGIISILILSFCTMIKNIGEYDNINVHKGDLYNIEKSEEEVIKETMELVNDYGFENIEKDGEFYVKKQEFSLLYNGDKKCFYLTSYKNNIIRKINYRLEEGKVIFVPSYEYVREVSYE